MRLLELMRVRVRGNYDSVCAVYAMKLIATYAYPISVKTQCHQLVVQLMFAKEYHALAQHTP